MGAICVGIAAALVLLVTNRPHPGFSAELISRPGDRGPLRTSGSYIHAPRTGDVVKISSLSESYYVASWVGARRVL
jgi:hypothetical protein